MSKARLFAQYIAENYPSCRMRYYQQRTVEIRNRLMKAGNMIFVDGGHFKSLQLLKSLKKNLSLEK